jgi:PleD family two-component response regulator
MKRADAAMYQVKASGRAGISFYTEELSNNAPVRE